MTGTNHIVAGAVISSAITAPVVALPLAFASHFVLDALPHYGDSSLSWAEKRSKQIIATDTVVAATLLLLIIIMHPARWPLMIVGGLVALTPDLMWLPNYIRVLRGLDKKQKNALMRFHKKIQWGERPWGLIIEFLWFIAIVPFLYFAVQR